MQQIEIKTVCPQSPQAAIAGDDHIVTTGVLGQHLAHQEGFVAATLDRLTDQNFSLTVGIHFRGVDQSETEVEAQPKRGDFIAPPRWILSEMPRSLPQRWHHGAERQPDRAVGPDQMG